MKQSTSNDRTRTFRPGALWLLAAFLVVSMASTAEAGGVAKVKVCHIPPGNPANWHTITVGAPAVPAHLAHGDLLGTCQANCETLCDDGNACTADCDVNGQCQSGVQVDCDDSNACTADSCNPVDGLCEYADIVVCDDSDLCTYDACDPLSGQCFAPQELACDEGWSCDDTTGDCAADVDVCEPDPCGAWGTCSAQQGEGGGDTAVCSCSGGYDGPLCDVPPDGEGGGAPPVDVCEPDPCGAWGSCSVESGEGGDTAVCTCTDGYTGQTCDTPPDGGEGGGSGGGVCEPDPCGTHGSCSVESGEGGDTAVCTCTDGYSGQACDNPPGGEG